MEVRNIPRRGLNNSRRYEIVHRGIKCSTEGVEYSTEKYSTELSNTLRRGLNIPRKYQIFHGGIK